MAGNLADLINRDRNVAFRALENVERENIQTVEGQDIPGAKDLLTMRAIMATEHVIVLYSIRKKGMTDPQHKHDDHDTVCTLVSGHLRVHVGDESFDARSGATWRHRPGVKHYSETLEDSVVLEIKTPPAKTW
jgi:quercetin dioxygenase-like cupin family protein